jgi:hypothetical protein
MPIIKVYKVADVIDGNIVFSPSAKRKIPGVKGRFYGGFDRIRTFEYAAGLKGHGDDSVESTFEYDAGWTLLDLYPSADLDIKSFYWRPHDMLPNLRRYLSRYSEDNMVFIPANKPTRLVYFRDRLFMSERVASPSERAEVVLRVKKAVYDEEAELSGLRDAIANLEAAREYQKSGPKRDAIPEDVKLLVWSRDGGRCVRCGSDRALHFDHIIPVAKGGSNTAANIEILCQVCNLRKSDRIAIT